MKSLEYYFNKARKEGWAIGQFNFSDFKVLEAVVLAAKEMRAPVILGTSEGESKSLGLKQIVGLVRSFRKETGLPLFLNLDHGKSFGYIKEAIDAGYDTVHFDGSCLSLVENIKITKKVANYARKKNIPVEGEVGFIKGSSKILKKTPQINEEDLTDPKEAEKFIKETKVDRLAVNIGTFHGMRASGRNPRINLKRLKEIEERVGKTPLVLHGGSGTPKEDIKASLRLGIAKININTELRVVFNNVLKEALKKPEIVPYKYMPEVVAAVQKVVADKIRIFGSANKI
ncbi:MAG: class II fructose-bisphosphate aldolase [Candidatus Nealsonbacteria bacterium]